MSKRPRHPDMPVATYEAFQTPWDECTPEQRALREAWLPTRQGDARAEYHAELVRRFKAGEPLTLDAKRTARRLIREAK